MKQSTIWGFHRAGIICLNTYLIFSLNFVAIFAHGTPDRINSDNIHSSYKDNEAMTNKRDFPRYFSDSWKAHQVSGGGGAAADRVRARAREKMKGWRRMRWAREPGNYATST